MKNWQRLKKNPNLFKKHFIRQKLIQETRSFFLAQGFHEVETPILCPSLIPESYLEVFETYLLNRKRQKTKMFLTTSPEASLKKLLIAGIGNCFEITKSFRNTETGSIFHNPEFTMLEWYRIPANYKDIMRDCEELLMYIYRNCYHATERGSKIKYQGREIDITPPWERLSVLEALKRYAHISLDDITDMSQKSDDLRFSIKKIGQVAQKKGYKVGKQFTWEQIFNQIFLNEIEPRLGVHGQPTIIFDYPRPLAAFAKVKEVDPRLVERFEFYIAGLELGDCYNESTDAAYLKKRYEEELTTITKNHKISVIPDLDFIAAMSHPLPPYSGIAVGMDRLAMLFTDSTSIEEVLYFPIGDMINKTD